MTDKEKKQKDEFIEEEQENLDTLKEKFLKDDPGYSWYFLNVLSTQEEVIRDRIEAYVRDNHLEEDVLAVLLPEVTVYTIDKGVKEEKKKKLYPGYILIKLKTILPINDDEEKNLALWYNIRNVNGVIDFVGTKETHMPIPVSKKELLKIFKTKTEQEKSRKYEYKIGNRIKISKGPFTDFIGEVEDLDESKLQLTVVLSVFGRQTPIQIGFDEVEKI